MGGGVNLGDDLMEEASSIEMRGVLDSFESPDGFELNAQPLLRVLGALIADANAGEGASKAPGPLPPPVSPPSLRRVGFSLGASLAACSDRAAYVLRALLCSSGSPDADEEEAYLAEVEIALLVARLRELSASAALEEVSEKSLEEEEEARAQM